MMYIFAAIFFFLVAWLGWKIFMKIGAVVFFILAVLFVIALVIYGLIPFMAHLFSHSILAGIAAIVVLIIIIISLVSNK